MLVTGARLKLYINSRMIGEVTGFSFVSSAQKRAIYGIDATEPFEFVPGVTSVRGRVSILRPSGLGSLEGYGITNRFEDSAKEKYVSIMLFDRKNQFPVFQTERAVITNQSWDVRSRGVMSGTFEFEAFKWINEAGFLLGWSG
jgi:hypothetical protein